MNHGRLLVVWILLTGANCVERSPRTSQAPQTQPAAASAVPGPDTRAQTTQATPTQPAGRPNTIVIHDTLQAKPRPPRDLLERWAQWRGPDMQLIDKLMDERTEPPPYDRLPPPPVPADARIARGLAFLNEDDPFPRPLPFGPKEITVRVGIARSTYRTRTREEVLSAAQPFVDIVHRDVNMRGEPVLYETAEGMFYRLQDGRVQMGIANVFDYYLIQGWFANFPQNRAILLMWAQPAFPYTTPLDEDAPGPRGAGIVLLVAQEAPYKTFADLNGTRLALPAHYTNAPGTFLTQQLREINRPAAEPFFGSVTLRRYSKDAVIDVLKGKADVACVDESTLGAIERFYGIGRRLRVVAVSPHYKVDVLMTSLNNVRTHRTQIELTQRMLLTLGKDPEGQEVLFFFDFAQWNPYRQNDLQAAAQHFDDFLRFFQETPADLKPLLDPKAQIDMQTYDRYGDE